MITFDLNGVRFTYRAAAVILDGERVLLNRMDDYDWWFLPGGRVEIGESAASALAREIQEELDASVEVDRLLWVAEVFFTFLTGRAHHELGFYFLAHLAPDSPLRGIREPFPRDDSHVRLIFQWHPLAALPDLPLYPIFLRQSLRTLPHTPVYVVRRE
jgi:ADP-ribose pyrophosphatase YjhB (NUDIX family)